MESKEQTFDRVQPIVDERLTFDQYVQQLPSKSQSVHRWLVWLVGVAIVITLGVLVYAVYASISWMSVGESNVVLAWMYFFLASAVAAFLLGLDTLILGATIPLPSEGSKYSYETGRNAVRTGWGLVGYGVFVTILVIVGVAAVRAGMIGLEDWITFIVGFFVILGLGSGVLAILRRILRPKRI